MLAEVALKFTVGFTYASESSQSLDTLTVSLVKGANSHTVKLGDSGYKLSVDGLGFGHWNSSIDVLWPLGGTVQLSVVGMPIVNGKRSWDTSAIAVVAQLSEI
jgi:hypothetical protein